MSSCQHELMESTVNRPARCGVCNAVLWIWEGKFLHCEVCKTYFHITCMRGVGGISNEQVDKKEEGIVRKGNDGKRGVRKEWCQHTFVRDVLTRAAQCDYCKRVLWLWDGKFPRCPLCGIFYHESCFDEIVLNKVGNGSTGDARFGKEQQGVGGERSDISSAFEFISDDAKRSLQDEELRRRESTTAHTVHVFKENSFVIPRSCNVCGKWILGKGFECTECNYFIHPRCLSALPHAKFAPVASGACQSEASPSSPVLQHKEGLEEVMGLLKGFRQRNDRFQKLLNPITLISAASRQKDLFDSQCASLPDSTISPDDLLAARIALRYATGVYGKAYEDGYFSSLGSASTIRLFGGQAVMHPKSEINNQAVCNVAALPRSALRMSHWSDSVEEPSYVVLADDADRVIALVFRGSLTDDDWIADARSTTVSYCGAQAHAGISKMADYMFSDGTAFDLMRSLSQEHPSYELWIAGHSLGAALSCLVTARCVSDCTLSPATPRGFAFAPPPVMSLPRANDYDDYIISFIAGKDAVCRLQLNVLDRLCVEMDAGTEGSPAELADQTEELHIVGRPILLTHPTSRSKLRVVDVRRTHGILHQLTIGAAMIEHHFMDVYGLGLLLFSMSLDPGRGSPPPASASSCAPPASGS